MIEEVILIYSEDDNVLYAKPVNNPKKLRDAIENSRLIETNNQAVIDKFRTFIHDGIVKKGVVRYNGEDFEIEKYGHYTNHEPSFVEENIQDLSHLLT